MVGMGHGPGFIRQRMMEVLERKVPVLATDPHPENKRAIAANKKLGFQIVGPVQQTQWGLILPMEARANRR
jgi:aminoglycoside 6'-N-acetyltransferase